MAHKVYWHNVHEHIWLIEYLGMIVENDFMAVAEAAQELSQRDSICILIDFTEVIYSMEFHKSLIAQAEIDPEVDALDSYLDAANIEAVAVVIPGGIRDPYGIQIQQRQNEKGRSDHTQYFKQRDNAMTFLSKFCCKPTSETHD